MKRYLVRFEMEVVANSPEHAAMIARDIMLDPEPATTPVLFCDVLPMEYYEPAGDYLPDEDHGWYARFTRPGVAPEPLVEWDAGKP